MNVILRGTEGVLAEESKKQVWALLQSRDKLKRCEIRKPRGSQEARSRWRGLSGCDPGGSTGDGPKAIYSVKLRAKPHGAERNVKSAIQEGNTRRKRGEGLGLQGNIEVF